MPRFRFLTAALATALLTAGCGVHGKFSRSRFTADDFRKLLATLALGWNTGNARMAADCFAETAMYSSPPDPHILKGRQALFEYFGGEKGRAEPMSMLWHHVVFDESTQIGMAEYTFTYRVRTHGMVIIRVVNGRIANWREYGRESPLNWEEMIGENRF